MAALDQWLHVIAGESADTHPGDRQFDQCQQAVAGQAPCHGDGVIAENSQRCALASRRLT